ncbi:hypothetical protein [Kutzneria buriramensis]|uniref:Uncharacterized protein n=1 Tax=Kutzneria buriramensis TaxID=1045776 RepID=A0A3E0HDI2_9PSEU|nr:hypothetical protein [Kutzneria buriramensis]REH42907.1 hypothetical protein BCF44_110412 [Kutzneria buriramensis]
MKSLLQQALGDEEPPMAVDVEAAERQGSRALRRRRQVIPLATAAIAVAVVAGGVIFVTARNPVQLPPAAHGQPAPTTPISTAAPSDITAAYCYRTPNITTSLDKTNQHVMVGVNGHIEGGRGDVRGAIMDICRQAWEANYYDWFPAGSGKHAAPPLVACVLDADAVDAMAGTIGVFPGDAQTCANMGLPVARI